MQEEQQCSICKVNIDARIYAEALHGMKCEPSDVAPLTAHMGTIFRGALHAHPFLQPGILKNGTRQQAAPKEEAKAQAIIKKAETDYILRSQEAAKQASAM